MNRERRNEILRMVRDRIARREERYICIALNYLYCAGMASKAECNEIRRFVHSFLGRHPSLESWLFKHCEEALGMLENNVHRIFSDRSFLEKTRATRLAWIDWMMEQP